MQFDSIHLASYVVLYAGSTWLIDALFKDGDKRREGQATKLKFEDSSTSQLRKGMLLARYSKEIVDAHGYKFRSAAHNSGLLLCSERGCRFSRFGRTPLRQVAN